MQLYFVKLLPKSHKIWNGDVLSDGLKEICNYPTHMPANVIPDEMDCFTLMQDINIHGTIHNELIFTMKFW
jgi:hypothetical protein